MATHLRKLILDPSFRNWVSASLDGGPGLSVRGGVSGGGGLPAEDLTWIPVVPQPSQSSNHCSEHHNHARVLNCIKISATGQETVLVWIQKKYPLRGNL